MTVPKEISLPDRSGLIETYLHTQETFASELVRALGGKHIDLQENGRLTLPEDSLMPNADIHVSPYLNLPVGTRTLSGLFGGPYEKLPALDYIYSQFGTHVAYTPETHIVTVTTANTPVRVSTEQTYFNYSDAAYRRMIFGLLTCFSEQDRPLIQDVQRNGVLITTGERSTETALFVPGKLMQILGLAALSWQGAYESTALYPVDVHKKTYEIWDRQGRKDVRTGVELLLSRLRPIGVRVQSDTAVNVYIRNR